MKITNLKNVILGKADERYHINNVRPKKIQRQQIGERKIESEGEM